MQDRFKNTEEEDMRMIFLFKKTVYWFIIGIAFWHAAKGCRFST
jgi:hypothetical protein